VAGLCEDGNKPSGSMIGENFLTKLLLASPEGPCCMKLVKN
jgi:hypothetical protein